ncbi:hypothetical protein CJF32_00010714 [Rutstroemia sp. NJR-2017a WRK4]|nr:hypothetical protein CJF32_00010714 [Rutstroemia sp. NJR-2017a WRK4]
MSVREGLHSRNQNHLSSPAPSRSTPSYQPIPFPDYTPPSCPLSITAQHSLSSIRSTRNMANLKKHLEAAIQNVTDTTVENNDRLQARVQEVEQLARKRSREKDERSEVLERRYTEMEKYERQFGKRVDVLTQEAERAMRQLIDMGEEVEMQEGLLEGVAGRIAMGRREGGDGEEDEDGDGESKVVISAVELLFEAKEDYKRSYEGQSMTKRHGLFCLYTPKTTLTVPSSASYTMPNTPKRTPPRWAKNRRGSPASTTQEEEQQQQNPPTIAMKVSISRL